MFLVARQDETGQTRGRESVLKTCPATRPRFVDGKNRRGENLVWGVRPEGRRGKLVGKGRKKYCEISLKVGEPNSIAGNNLITPHEGFTTLRTNTLEKGSMEPGSKN